MSDGSPPLSEAAQAVADSKIPPGDEYEEIREQVRGTRRRSGMVMDGATVLL